MGWILLIVLIGWPVLEIAVFIQMADSVGLLAAIVLFIAAGIVGMALLRNEGFALLMRAQRQMNEGVAPINEGFDALCLGLAGLLLLLPGFISDVFALLLILPPLRRWLRRRLVGWVAVREARTRTGAGLVIEGEFEDVTRAHDPRKDDPDKIVRRRD